MKKLKAIITLAFLGAYLSEAQTYHPFPESNAGWRFHCASGFMGENQWCLNYLVSVNDTIINNITYNKLFENFYYKGAYRNDSLNRKIFFIPVSDSSEALWYDFSLSVGDTFLAPQNIFDVCFSSKKILTAIDSILYSNEYRKAFHFVDSNGCCATTVIEGIGSLEGLFQFYDVCFETGCGISYFSESNDTILFNQLDSCNWPLSAFDNKLASSVIISVPNPFFQTASIKIDNIFSSDTELQIVDVTGRIIKTYKISSPLQTEIIISAEEIGTGIFFVQLIKDRVVKATKKIVTLK